MTSDDRLREYLKRVTVELHDARLRLREAEHQGNEAVAIVGMGCRYPGGVSSPEGLWKIVRDGRDVISGFPADRGWGAPATDGPGSQGADSSHLRDGGFLGEASEFDADFFGISPREALAMDPQQRLLLEVSWEAIEEAGIDPASLKGTSTGVFVGGATNGYGLGLSDAEAERVAGYQGSGTLSSVMSGRVSYTLGLEGPAVTIDTACSSSLVALHVACASLRAGESSLALVAGVNIMPTAATFLELSRQGGLAPDGRCKSFSDTADGTGWGEGAGALLVERVSDARRLGHRILAILRGSAINQDGASNGLTAPNGPSQQRVIRQALGAARLAAHQVDVVEAHGTGTTLGDPIEAQALLATYGQGRREDSPLWLGSIKSNIGHTQAAAGVAAVIKMVMALRYELLPKTLHAEQPSRQVNWSKGSVSLLREEVAWPRGGEPRRAGVSSFGVSGTNAHVILEEACDLPARESDAAPAGAEDSLGASSPIGLLEVGAPPLILSARTENALYEQAARLSSFLGENAEVPLADVGLSLTRRSVFEHRAVVVDGDRSELVSGLDAMATGAMRSNVVKGTPNPAGPGAIAFVFPGQGSQWRGMALELLDRSSVFAERLHECDEAFLALVDWSVRDVLRGADGAPELDRIEVVQPVLFAVMVSLAELWSACGVRPSAVVGHSQGEIAAAYVAGGLSLTDAARVVGLRSQMFSSLAGHGAVASVALDVERVRSRIAPWGERMSIAGVNGPASVAVAGDREALSEFLRECHASDVRAREVPATVASHSPHVEGLRDELIDILSGIRPRSGEVPFYSTVTGGLLDTATLDEHYWYRNLREPVEFERATRALLADGHRTFVEVSSHPVLAVALNETVEDALARGPSTEGQASTPAQETTRSAGAVGIHGSLRRDEGDRRRFLMSLGELWVRGVEVDWRALFEEIDAETVGLPSYPFQRRRYWLQGAAAAKGDVAMLGQRPVGHPILGAAVALAEGDGWLFTGRMSAQSQPWLPDHMVNGRVVVPGTTFVEVALSAGAQVECPHLGDLVFEAPLVLAEDRTVCLQVRLGAPEESGARTVAIYSRPEDQPEIESDSWTRHARGVLAPDARDSLDGRSELEMQASRFAAGTWPPAGAQPVAVDDLYDYFAGVGLEYGPCFLGVQSAWRRGEEAFTEVSLPEDQHAVAREFNVHPALLDCALQAGGLLMRTENPATPEHAVLPFAWSQVRLHSEGRSSLRVRMARREDGGMSVLAADEEGRPVLSAESVMVRKIVPGQLGAPGSSDRDSLFCLEWIAHASADGQSSTTAPTGWAVLGEQTAVRMRDLVSEQQAGESLGVVAYPEVGAAGEAIDKGGSVPESVLVYLGSDRSAEGMALVGETRAMLDVGLSLVREWLADERLGGTRLVFVTDGAVCACPGEDVSDLPAASLWGLLRSAQSENPGRFTLVDLDGSTVSPQDLEEALAAQEPQIALRDGELLVARLRRMKGGENHPPEAVQPSIGKSTSGEPGTVLITGGTGALGAELARHLVREHGVRDLLLTSRKGAHAPGAERLEGELLELGARASIVACDVSDRDRLARLLGSVGHERPLSAVVHLAGALEDGTVASMTPQRLDRVLAPKADAAWHLHELTKELDLSAFIVFSSSTGTFGGAGQSNYAAANMFLDSLVAHRRARGLPGISMAWGWWETSEGMGGDLSAVDRARMERSGMLALSAEQGLALFDAAYAANEPLVVPARLDMAGLRNTARGGVLPPLLRGLVRTPVSRATSGGGSLPRRLAGTPESERERIVLEVVCSEVASVLGHDSPDAIDAHRAFNELGFDSLAAVELRNRLATTSGRPLPATLVFDHPTAQALTTFLLTQISPERVVSGENGTGESELREAIAAIPLARLREAGVMDTLMGLAGLTSVTSVLPDQEDAEGSIDEMDLESLVKMTLEDAQALETEIQGQP